MNYLYVHILVEVKVVKLLCKSSLQHPPSLQICPVIDPNKRRFLITRRIFFIHHIWITFWTNKSMENARVDARLQYILCVHVYRKFWKCDKLP